MNESVNFATIVAVPEGFNQNGPCHRLYGLTLDGRVYRFMNDGHGTIGWQIMTNLVLPPGGQS